MNFEHCAECDSMTGNAGRYDGSLYHAHEGPFCRECYDAWDELVIEDRDRLRKLLAKQVVMPERCNELQSDGNPTYEAQAYNQCLDDISRLNPALATHSEQALNMVPVPDDAARGTWLIEYMASEREDLDDTLMMGCSENRPDILRSIIDKQIIAARPTSKGAKP